MNKLVIGAILLAPFGAKAECWVVDNLKGQSQFSPDYVVQKDKAIGTYYVSISGSEASLSSADNAYHSGLQYTPLSTMSMIGRNEDSALTETWTITSGGKALYTKVRNNSAGMSQLSSFIGDVKGKC
ncbi:hypothetical protein L1O22_003172 [Salmonella enterica]|nr:hypothetical protein [Salmonella enterica]